MSAKITRVVRNDVVDGTAIAWIALTGAEELKQRIFLEWRHRLEFLAQAPTNELSLGHALAIRLAVQCGIEFGLDRDLEALHPGQVTSPPVK